MRNFVSELRRRNVLRVATAYALSAWIIIEAGSVLLPTFGASERSFRIYVIFVAAGFVVAVILAWIYQVTPEGVKRDRDAPQSAPVDRRARVRMNYVIIALLIIALTVSLTLNVTTVDNGTTQSIAVLPFTSRSTNPENSLFADGIHDDLLTRLANIKALKVISRTSVMEYRDTTKNIRQIAEELGVESVLEGAVQRIGDNVRINLQLIDARTDEHIWAQTYDHQLTMQNIFSVQSEISEAVANALRATLSPEERVRIAAVPTRDLRAYRLYKEARNNLYQRRRDSILQAREEFAEAIELDPHYAEAHAGLAESIMLLMINHNEIPENAAMTLARVSVERALEYDPDLADAYAILGLMKYTDWSRTRMGTENIEAEAAFRRAIALKPNHVSAYMWFASLRDAEERFDEAIDLYQKAIELDPLARIPYLNLPTVYSKLGQHRAAMQLWLEATRIHDDWPLPYQYIALELWGLGRLDEAYAWYMKSLEFGDDPGPAGSLDAGIFIDLGDFERARQVLIDFPESNMEFPLVQGTLLLIDGHYGEASASFAEVIESRRLPAKFVYPIASDSALLAGDLETAKKYALAQDPILAGDTATKVDRYTTRNAVKLAYIDQREGRGEEAARLLLATLAVLRETPRLGTYGFGIRDVQIYALLGRPEDAIAAFREAIDAGYRGSLLFDTWPLSIDPYLDNVRDDPRFAEMVQELDNDLEVMRSRLLQAEAAGNLDTLRSSAETI
ncbi:MAG: tetratricopeptide repeat protein [Woeseiaceae bacterium]